MRTFLTVNSRIAVDHEIIIQLRHLPNGCKQLCILQIQTTTTINKQTNKQKQPVVVRIGQDRMNPLGVQGVTWSELSRNLCLAHLISICSSVTTWQRTEVTESNIIKTCWNIISRVGVLISWFRNKSFQVHSPKTHLLLSQFEGRPMASCRCVNILISVRLYNLIVAAHVNTFLKCYRTATIKSLGHISIKVQVGI